MVVRSITSNDDETENTTICSSSYINQKADFGGGGIENLFGPSRNGCCTGK